MVSLFRKPTAEPVLDDRIAGLARRRSAQSMEPVDNAADPALLDTIAPLIAEHCLVGWDTNGESWEP